MQKQAGFREGAIVMKKAFNCLIILFSVFFWGFFFLVLQFDSPKPADTFYDYRFTFISPFANAGYWGSTARGMIEADQAYGTNTKFVGFMQSDSSSMSQAIQSEIRCCPDGLITAGNSDPMVISALKEAHNAGMPIVLIDNDCLDVDRLCYIGADNYEMGQLAGKSITADLSVPLYAAVIIGNSSVENQRLRLQGFQDELALHPDCHIEAVLEADYSLLNVRQMLPCLLKENPKINAVFCAEGYSSIIAGEILTTMGKEYDNMRVVVSGNTEEILNHVASGRYISTIIQESDAMGVKAVEVLKNYQNGIVPEHDVIYIDNITVTQKNLDNVTAYESEGVTWHLYNGNLLRIPQSEN